MTNYGFGEDEELSEQQGQVAAPKWFRERMDKVSEQLNELKAENDQLKAEQAKAVVKNTLTAQGYAPGVADLYTGTPDGLNDWLSANGALFAKAAGAAEGEQLAQTQQGPPATTVGPESQAQQAAFAAAGEGGSAPLSGDGQLEARLAAAATQEEFNAIMRDAGNVRFN